ncbi:LysR family transcriptional regulator [Bradyrhizobium altum]|uniref:LysR family transcriptional regulator n=1 Tax=Bradyrhizobium altum TaxID=1571202 RepID=UPI001E2DA26D|nr:LysR family transcriptional regulator [Bradyrhizobium altum]
MSDHLLALRLFVRVARKGSFSAAGRELEIPQSTASRVIAALERRIGSRLFLRNTRAVTLTDDGAEFLARVEMILAELGLDAAPRNDKVLPFVADQEVDLQFWMLGQESRQVRYDFPHGEARAQADPKSTSELGCSPDRLFGVVAIRQM